MTVHDPNPFVVSSRIDAFIQRSMIFRETDPVSGACQTSTVPMRHVTADRGAVAPPARPA
jgi:hypothetical protein